MPDRYLLTPVREGRDLVHAVIAPETGITLTYDDSLCLLTCGTRGAESFHAHRAGRKIHGTFTETQERVTWVKPGFFSPHWELHSGGSIIPLKGIAKDGLRLPDGDVRLRFKPFTLEIEIECAGAPGRALLLCCPLLMEHLCTISQ